MSYRPMAVGLTVAAMLMLAYALTDEHWIAETLKLVAVAERREGRVDLISWCGRRGWGGGWSRRLLHIRLIHRVH